VFYALEESGNLDVENEERKVMLRSFKPKVMLGSLKRNFVTANNLEHTESSTSKTHKSMYQTRTLSVLLLNCTFAHLHLCTHGFYKEIQRIHAKKYFQETLVSRTGKKYLRNTLNLCRLR